MGVTHPKTQHLGELALQVIVPRPPKALEQHPLYVLNHHLQAAPPKALEVPKVLGTPAQKHSSAIPFASLFSTLSFLSTYY